MKRTLLTLLLGWTAIASASAQAPATVAGMTLYTQEMTRATSDAIFQSAYDLHADGTYSRRFYFAIGDYFSSATITGTYSYSTTPNSNSATVNWDAQASAILGSSLSLVFTSVNAGTLALFPGFSSGTFSLSPTGGDLAARAIYNVSTLLVATPGSPVSIGFIVGGTAMREVLIRAVGPSLGQFGINNFAPDPGYVLNAPRAIELTGGTGQIPGPPTGWSATPGSTGVIANEGARVGAFPLLGGSNDKAEVILLPPGPYSITVSPKDSSGAGYELIEVYEVE